jgi:hypothetical protein
LAADKARAEKLGLSLSNTLTTTPKEEGKDAA